MDIRQTLAAVQGKKSGDKAARKMQAIQKDIQCFSGFWEQLSDAEKEKMDALSEETLERMDRLNKRCEKENSRLQEARYYDSAALKDILENLDEFSSFVEPAPEECSTPDPDGNVLSPDSEDLLPPN